MNYYIWKLNEKVVAYRQTTDVLPSPAIKVTEEEFRDLGYYTLPAPLFADVINDQSFLSPTISNQKRVVSALMEGIQYI